jgi:tetratricopeptide (TPR) repeat protein
MIRQKLYSFEEYCAAYTRRRKDLLSVRPVQASADYQYTVYTTWDISVASIREMAQAPTGPSKESHVNASNALDLLNFFGFCHFDGISEDLFEGAWRNLPEREAESPWWVSHVIPMLRENRLSKWDFSPFREATSLLATYSLISVTSNGISLHPLVHSWIRDSMNEEMQLQWWTTSVSTLAMATATDKPYSHYRRLVTHMQSCLSTRSLADLLVEDEESQERVEIVYWVLIAYELSHVNKDGVVLGTQALKYSQKMLGDDHGSTWYLLSMIARMYNKMGQCQETLDLLEARVTAAVESAASRSKGFISCACWLVNALMLLEHSQEAVKLAQKIMDVCEEFLADDDDLVYIIKGRLAMSYQEVGRIKEAVELLESVVEHRRRTLDEDCSGTILSMTDLGIIYTEAGRYQEAVELFQQVLEDVERSYSDEHLNSLIARANLAWAYSRCGKPEAGIPLLVKAIELGEKTGVPHDYLQRWKGRLEECEAYQQPIEAAEASTPGQQHREKGKGFRNWLRGL